MNAMAPSTAAQVASRRARLWDAGFRPFALYSHDCLSHDCLTVPSDHRGKQLNLIPERSASGPLAKSVDARTDWTGT